MIYVMVLRFHILHCRYIMCHIFSIFNFIHLSLFRSFRIWDFGVSADAVEIHEHHTEFVCGLDWNANKPHQLADCGWDSVINIFTPKTLKM